MLAIAARGRTFDRLSHRWAELWADLSAAFPPLWPARQYEEAHCPRMREIVHHAPRYAEGQGVRLEVRNQKDLADVQALASIKMAT